MSPSAIKTIMDFHALYCGGIAEEQRAAGVPDVDAVPPWARVSWLGHQVVKCPMDLWVYQEILWETRPDLLIETGTSGGGSAYFFATIMDSIGNGRILTVDVDSYPVLNSQHPRIGYLVGSSIDPVIIDRIHHAAKREKTVMVSLDSLHTYAHVAAELEAYASLVTVGQYLVVEDTGMGELGESPNATPPDHENAWANLAVREFLASHSGYTADVSREKHLLTSNHNGWIRRNN